MRQLTRIGLAMAAAAVLFVVNLLGWYNVTRRLADGAGWLWHASWPIIWYVVLPTAVFAGLYYFMSTASWRGWLIQPKPPSAVVETLRRARLPLAGASVIAALSAAVLFAPGWLVSRDTTIGKLTPEQRAKATSDARTALLQAVGGLVLAGGALATWRQLRISREGQVTERFTRAVDQLGAEHLASAFHEAGGVGWPDDARSPLSWENAAC